MGRPADCACLLWHVVDTMLFLHTQVKTMRGHKSNIKSVVVVEGRAIDWENPGPPLVVTLSEDKSVKAWDVLQASALMLCSSLN